MNSRISNRYLRLLRSAINPKNAKALGQQPQTALARCVFGCDDKSRRVAFKAKSATAALQLNGVKVAYPISGKMSKLSKQTVPLGCVCGDLKAMPQLLYSMQFGQYQQQRGMSAVPNDKKGNVKCESRMEANGIDTFAQPKPEDQVNSFGRVTGTYSQNVIDEDDECFWSMENTFPKENDRKEMGAIKDDRDDSELITWKWK